MSIATERGDQGMTMLRHEAWVNKSDVRIELLGTCDELNAFLGMVRANTPAEKVKERIRVIQLDLLSIGADLATSSENVSGYRKLKSEAVERLDVAVIEYESKGTRARGFVLPGEDVYSAMLHVARTVCRRLERRVVAYAELESISAYQMIIRYLNRLSDLLWLMAT